VLDYAGFSTLDSVIRAQQVFGVEQMLVITQPDQAQRALMICDAYDIDCTAYGAQDVSMKIAPRIMIRERFAKVKVILDLYVWNAQPRYIGMQEQVPRKPAKESIQR
jgi:SanA protein